MDFNFTVGRYTSLWEGGIKYSRGKLVVKYTTLSAHLSQSPQVRFVGVGGEGGGGAMHSFTYSGFGGKFSVNAAVITAVSDNTAVVYEHI